MFDICGKDGCELEAKYDGKCALHCEKGKKHDDDERAILADFFEQLTGYVYCEIEKSLYEDEFKKVNNYNKIRNLIVKEGKSKSELELETKINTEKEQVLSVIKGKRSSNASGNNIKEKLSQLEVVYQDIYFPKFGSQNEKSNYCRILSISQNATFQNCQFESNHLDIKADSFFHSCDFRGGVGYTRLKYARKP